MNALAWLVVSLAASANTDAWLDATLEIVNPRSVGGQTLLTIGDLVGPEARSETAAAGPIRAVCLVRLDPADCAGPGSPCHRFAEGLREVAGSGRVLAVLVAVPSSGREERERARLSPPPEVAVAFDARGVAARVLGLERRGRAAVIFSDGRRVDLDLPWGSEPARPVVRTLAAGL